MAITAGRDTHTKFIKTVRQHVRSVDGMMVHGKFVHDKRMFPALDIFSGSGTPQMMLELFNVVGGMQHTKLGRHALGMVGGQGIQKRRSVEGRTTPYLSFLIDQKVKSRRFAHKIVPIVATALFGDRRKSMFRFQAQSSF
jgi:hypothetical protein